MLKIINPAIQIIGQLGIDVEKYVLNDKNFEGVKIVFINKKSNKKINATISFDMDQLKITFNDFKCEYAHDQLIDLVVKELL
ncbi:MAG: hypothetical protein IJW36_03070 [Clostridia bacterium]|nr:hypothetical protein [Clostridia bacterium]